MDLNRAVLALNALAQETRLQIIRILVPAGSNGVAAGVIAETLGVAPPTLSFHLQQLIFSGLIEKRRASRSLIYSVNAQGMRQLVEFLTEDCCGGRPELCLPVRTETAKRVKVDTPKARKRAER